MKRIILLLSIVLSTSMLPSIPIPNFSPHFDVSRIEENNKVRLDISNRYGRVNGYFNTDIKEGHIETLGVYDPFSSTGVDSQLLMSMIDELRSEGSSRVWVELIEDEERWSSLDEQKRFFSRHGFTVFMDEKDFSILLLELDLLS